jgi:tRNA threonylcarbamoyladenosine biosynthesis protein TsaE
VLHHLDVYRLSQLNEVLDLGLAEMLDEGGVVVIEWGDAVEPVVPSDYLEVRLALAAIDTPDDRDILLHPVGPHWSSRQRVLAEAIAPWAVGTGSGDTGTLGDLGESDEGVASC